MLRIEDTDRERSTPENVAQILDALEWLELDWDEGPISQVRARARAPRAARSELLDSGRAYPQRRDRRGRARVQGGEPGPRLSRRGRASEPAAAIRLHVPDEGATVVEDLIRGPISFENRLTGRPRDRPRRRHASLYNFAVAVDDAEMGITDVIRGDDHISNTPKQLLVLEALGFAAPRYAHLPLLHGPDGKKLSKRHGAASVRGIARGAATCPPRSATTWPCSAGAPIDDTTLLSTEELVERFDIARVGRSAPSSTSRSCAGSTAASCARRPPRVRGDARRRILIASTGHAEAASPRRRPTPARAACAIVQEKAQVVTEVWPLIAFLFTEPEPDEASWKKVMKPSVAEPLAAGLETPWRPSIRSRLDGRRAGVALRELIEAREIGARKLLQPIRVAISGSSISPGIFESLAALGPERSLRRIREALERLSTPDPGTNPVQG